MFRSHEVSAIFFEKQLKLLMVLNLYSIFKEHLILSYCENESILFLEVKLDHGCRTLRLADPESKIERIFPNNLSEIFCLLDNFKLLAGGFKNA